MKDRLTPVMSEAPHERESAPETEIFRFGDDRLNKKRKIESSDLSDPPVTPPDRPA